MKAVFKIEGLQGLEDALKELIEATSSSTGKRVLMRALADAAQPIADHAQQLVAVDTGELRNSIRVYTSSVNTVGKSEYRAVLKSGGSKAEAVAALRDARREAGPSSTVEVAVGPAGFARAAWIEFGTEKMAPRPYMRPAWDAGKDQVVNDIGPSIASHIDKAAQRAARRKARG